VLVTWLETSRKDLTRLSSRKTDLDAVEGESLLLDPFAGTPTPHSQQVQPRCETDSPSPARQHAPAGPDVEPVNRPGASGDHVIAHATA
jgi:hypothetical protein